MNTFLPVQAQPFTLYGAGCSSGATSVTLSSFTTPDGVQLTTANFGSIGYATIDPGNGSLEEPITFTGVTVNSNGTTTLTGISHQTFVSPWAQTSGTSQSHAGGAIIVLTNTAGFYNQFVAKNDDGTISEVLTFTVPNYPQVDVYTTEPTLSAQFATKYYVDQTAVSGAPNATTTVKGIIQLATSTQAAAGTATGSTGASLVPPNSLLNATSSAAVLIPVTNSSGKISSGFGGAASSLATLNSSSLVVQNPASATSTPTSGAVVEYNSSLGLTVTNPPVNTTDATPKAYVDANTLKVLTAVASNTLQFSANNIETVTNNTTFTIAKQITINLPGTYRVKFDGACGADAANANAQIFRNGVAYGTNQSLSTPTPTYTTFSQDLNFAPMDEIQIYFKTQSGAGHEALVKNFQVFFDPTPTTTYGTVDIN